MKHSVMAVALPVALLVLSGSLQAKAQDDQSCSDASLEGGYGFQVSGTVPGVLAIGAVARVMFDGQGHFTQTDTLQILATGQPPVFVADRPGSGTYTIEADCTGTYTLNAGGQTHHSRLVLVNHGKKVLEMGSDPGVIISGVGEKQ
jgi:hypothetical protein